ncbi:MAG: protein kinase [Gemmataceae bacterium]
MSTPSHVPPCRPRDESSRGHGTDAVSTQRLPGLIAALPTVDNKLLASPRRSRTPFPHIPGYELLEVLGRGGKGVVYKAYQHSLKRLVALKLIVGDEAGADDVARFFHEAEAIGALRHPNIVQVYEAGQHAGRPFLSLEYVAGGTLLQRIQGRAVPPKFAAEICETVARAVHAVHAIQIVHRDLKPANILLHVSDHDTLADERPRSGDGPEAVPVVKIADFGLAKRLDTTCHLTETGVVAGTPAYMAPEQIRGDRGRIGPAADIWAIGVILYEMLTGSLPFRADCPVRTMSDVLSENPVLPSRLVRGIPRDLETICLKCLEKSPARRYPTAVALAADLRRFREGRVISARRAGPAEQAWRWCARNPVIAGLLAGILAVFAAGAGVAWAYALRADENARLAKVEQQKAEANAREARAKEDEAVQAVAAANTARSEEMRQKGIATELAKQATDREARGVRERYALDANLSLKAWEAGDLLRSRQFLARYTPKSGADLRGFEWHYLDRLCRSEVRAIPLGRSSTRAIAFLPGSRRFAFGRGNEFGLYDLDRGVLEVVFRGHTSIVTALAYNPRTGQIASASRDGTVRVWDANTGAVAHTLRGHADEAVGLLYTPDGRTLISCGGRFSGLMKPGEVILWDAESGQTKHVIQKHASAICDIALSGDGKLLASCGFDSRVHIYDVESGTHVREVKLSRPLVSVAVHPGKKWFAAGSDSGPIAVCDLQTGALLRELHSHTDWVNSLACSPDGEALASGGLDRNVRVWNPDTGELLRNFRGHVGMVNTVRFKPNDLQLASIADDGVARIWDFRQNPEFAVLSANISEPVSVVPTTQPDGVYCIGLFGQGICISLATGRVTGFADTLSDEKFVREAMLLPNGDTLAIVRADGQINYATLYGRKTPPAIAQVTRGEALAASANGRWLAVRHDPQWVHIHDLTQPGDPTKLSFWAEMTAMAFGPGDDPMLAIATGVGAIALFRPDGGRAGAIAIGRDIRVSRLAFTPDGKALAGDDQLARIHLWDVRSGRELWCTEAHTDAVRSIAFSRRGDRIVTASMDRTAKVLDTETGRETISLRGHSRGLVQAIFAPDGASVITLGLDSKLLWWGGRPTD